MSHYLLVHGAWEGSWTWDETAAALKSNGHKVSTVDLAGSIGNPKGISDVTMENYIDTVIKEINKQDEKIILAGHSLAGAVISQVAERVPEKLERMIYIAAFMLGDGDSVLEAMQRDPKGEFLPEVVFSDDGTFATASDDLLRAKAFHDVEEKGTRHALSLMADRQATEPFMATVNVTNEKFGSVHKTYIRTALDKMMSPVLQEEMLGTWHVEEIHSLPSGHFPNLSRPEKLAELMS